MSQLPDFTVSPKPERPVQYFTPDYLERCKRMTTEQKVAFLEEFARLQQARRDPGPAKA